MGDSFTPNTIIVHLILTIVFLNIKKLKIDL